MHSPRVTFQTYPEIQGLELMSGAYVPDRFDAHMHEAFTIGVTLMGTEHFWCRGASHVAGPGDIALLNPHDVHSGGPGPEGYWSYQMVYAQPELLESVCSELRQACARALRFRNVIVTDPPLAAAIGSVQLQLQRACSALERQSLIHHLLSALVIRHSSVEDLPSRLDGESATIRKVKEYLRANLAADVRLEDLSALSGLSPYHLLRTFRRAVGMPPHAYLRQIRVEYAKRLLGAGMPISEVALTAGFSDQSHLTRFFKRILGMTPGTYVNAISSRTA